MQTLTREEFEKKYGKEALGAFPEKKAEKKGVLSSIGSSIKESFLKGKEQIQGTGEFEGSIAPVRGTQLAGTIGMAIPKAIGSGISPIISEGIKEGASEYIGKPIASGFNWIADTIGDTEAAQTFVTQYPEAAKFLEETAKVTGALSETAGGLMATKAVGSAAVATGKLATQGAMKVADVTRASAGALKTGLEKTADVIKTVGKPMWAETKTLLPKAQANLAQIKATEATLKKLSPAGQTAARSGVELPDIKMVTQTPKSAIPSYKKLLKVTQDFASGKSKTNPFEVVGKPITQGLKLAQSKANTIGSKIGKVADQLPNFKTNQIAPSVIANLKKVNGLSGLKVNSKGILDFKDTVLATAGTKADRLAIQRIFTDAIKSGSGKSKHLLRQELFEILGGKKVGGIQLTGTQERAFEAVRKGLADTLDKASDTYKALNVDYAKAMSPIGKLKKLLGSAGVDDDILNMKAGLLARRLTSFSKTNPELRQILRDLDGVIKTKGKTMLSTEQLQDFYNILDKYYDIAGQTGFQGQVTAGVSKAVGKSGLSRAVDIAEGQVTKLLGETEIVKQRALEALLKEVLGN